MMSILSGIIIPSVLLQPSLLALDALGATIGIISLIILVLPVYVLYRAGERQGRMEEVERYMKEKDRVE